MAIVFHLPLNFSIASHSAATKAVRRGCVVLPSSMVTVTMSMFMVVAIVTPSQCAAKGALAIPIYSEFDSHCVVSHRGTISALTILVRAGHSWFGHHGGVVSHVVMAAIRGMVHSWFGSRIVSLTTVTIAIGAVGAIVAMAPIGVAVRMATMHVATHSMPVG